LAAQQERLVRYEFKDVVPLMTTVYPQAAVHLKQEGVAPTPAATAKWQKIVAPVTLD